MRNTTRILQVLTFLFAVTAPALAKDCPQAILDSPKHSTLYVYFPLAIDNDFPTWDVDKPTSPLNAFDMSLHDPGISTSAVRAQTMELMRNAWCEFDLNVKLATSPPAPQEERWQIVGIGSDSSGDPDFLGTAQYYDEGDDLTQEHSRIWVSSIQDWVFTELIGPNSTPNRWANAIANLAVHESSHNYGGHHNDAVPQTGEDEAENHFMADPYFADPNSIVDRINHHSDKTYEKLGHDLGLAIKTIHNWDFVNPNAETAVAMTVTVLSEQNTLTVGWFYDGPLSPWGEPTVTKQNIGTTFQGIPYKVFDVKFEAARGWDHGPAGLVPGGEMYHVGATFDADVIVIGTKLHGNNAALPLQPRMFGYDLGTATDGMFDAKLFNTGIGDMVLSDVQVFYLPRMVDIEEMVVGGSMRGIGGMDVTPFARQPLDPRDVLPDRLAGPVRVTREQPYTMRLARLTDRRHLDQGDALSLFPATYTYVMATVTDPNAHYWDKRQRRYVDSPLSTRFFFQIAGGVPDANGNGVDDLLDIRRRTSRDDNNNGIPDEAEPRR